MVIFSYQKKNCYHFLKTGMRRPARTPMRRNETLYIAARLFFRIYFLVCYRVHKHGQEHLPQAGPVILVPKHQRWTDIPLVGLSVPFACHYIAKSELFMMPILKQLITWLGGVPLNRLQPIKSRESFRYIEYLLRQRQAIVLFPEGTYFPNTMGPGKYRLIQKLLALQNKLQERDQGNLFPFFPVGIHYGKEYVRPAVQIIIGQPLFCRRSDEAKEFTEKIMANIAQLSGIQTD